MIIRCVFVSLIGGWRETHLVQGLRAADPPQRVLEGREEGRVLQGPADRPDQVPVLLETGGDALRGEPDQAEGSSSSHRPAEVKGGGILQELPSEQVLLEATRGGAGQGLQSPAHRGEETMEDFDQARQEGGRIRLHWQELPERLEEEETGGRRYTRGGSERRLNGTGEEPGQGQATLRETVTKTRTLRMRR